MVSLVGLYKEALLPDEPGVMKIPISLHQFVLFNSLHNHEANFYTSVETIRRFVLGQGMRVTKKKGTIEISDRLQRLFDTEWMVVLSDILRHLIMYGVCIVDKNPHDIPIVRDPQEFNCVEIRWRNGTKLWQVTWRPIGASGSTNDVMGNTSFPRLFHAKPANSGSEDVLKTGFVIVRNHVDLDGTLRGDARRLFRMAQLQNYSMECSTSAWTRQSAPPVFMQHRAKTHGDFGLDRDLGQFADRDDVRADSLARRNDANVRLAARNEIMTRAINSAGTYSVPSVLKDPFMGIGRFPLQRTG